MVIGEGGAERELRAHARRRRLGDAVTFLGYVSETDLRALVAAADVAVVPSLYEPFGFVALEAIVLGAPLVVAGTGGLTTIVTDGETGWQFTPGDAQALSEALREVLSDPREARRRGGTGPGRCPGPVRLAHHRRADRRASTVAVVRGKPRSPCGGAVMGYITGE